MLVCLLLLSLLGVKNVLLGVVPNLMHPAYLIMSFLLINSKALRWNWFSLVK